MELFDQLIHIQVFGNSLGIYFFSAVFWLVGYATLVLVERIFKKKFKAYLADSGQNLPAFAAQLLLKLVFPLLHFAVFYLALTQLSLHPDLEKIATGAWIIFFAIQATRLAVSLAVYLIEEIWIKRFERPESANTFKSLKNIFKLAIWGVSTVFILDNLGFNISAVVAGLGIGGVAVALAAQTILGDLFNYFVIFFDKPFEVGDFIVFDDFMGTIENIGIKSTRIRSLSGEQIVISNTNLTSAKIRNYKHMKERRVVFGVGIIYETELEKVRRAPAMIREMIEKEPETRVDRVHFKSFGDSSLNLEAVYFVLNTDYNRYMDIQQRINMAILERFQKEGIEFAYPTTMSYHRSLPQNQL